MLLSPEQLATSKRLCPIRSDEFSGCHILLVTVRGQVNFLSAGFGVSAKLQVSQHSVSHSVVLLLVGLALDGLNEVLQVVRRLAKLELAYWLTF